MSQGHRQWLANQLPELISKGILNQDHANKLSEYFSLEEISSSPEGLSKMTIILAAVGGLLIGSGIIMIFAHNWDQIGRSTRTILALLPLAISQVFAVLALFPKQRGIAWREATAAFMFCAVPASIALIGQTYHISNDFQSFQTLWFILILPFIYLLKSKLTAFLTMGLAMWMASIHQDIYWLCAVSLLPFHFLTEPYGRKQLSLKIGWLFAIGLAFSSFVTLSYQLAGNGFALLSLMSGAAVIYFLGGLAEPKKGFWQRPFANIGAVSIAVTMLCFSFSDIWDSNYAIGSLSFSQLVSYQSFLILFAVLGLIWACLTKRIELLPLGSTIIFIFLITLIPYKNWHPDLFALIANIIVLALGVWYLWLGINHHSTSRMNFGLALIMMLILLRFFDQDFSFIVKGIAFIIMGCAFIAVNVWQSKRRQA